MNTRDLLNSTLNDSLEMLYAIRSKQRASRYEDDCPVCSKSDANSVDDLHTDGEHSEIVPDPSECSDAD